VSHRIADCCCKRDPCANGTAGACCMPDCTCVNVACEHECTKRGGRLFVPNQQCQTSSVVCCPPTSKCWCFDSTWRRNFVYIDIVRIYSKTEYTKIDDPYIPCLSEDTRTAIFPTYLSYTQAQIDAGLLPSQDQTNLFAPQYPIGITTPVFPPFVSGYVEVKCVEYRYEPQCCMAQSFNEHVDYPDDFYYDTCFNGGTSYGPYKMSWDRPVFIPPQLIGKCDECCCQGIQTSCSACGDYHP
jgi:hypothetical protein